MGALRRSLHYLHHHKWNFPHFPTALTSARGKFQQPDYGAVGPATNSKLSNDWRGGLKRKLSNCKYPSEEVLHQRPNNSSGDSLCKNIISTSRHTVRPGNQHYLALGLQQRHRPQLQHDLTREQHTEHKSSALQLDLVPLFF